MVIKVSSKGQLVIPKPIRKALGIQAGTEIHIEVVGHKIILEPIQARPPIEFLYGKYPKTDFLTEFEAEHREELTTDEALRT